MEMGEIEAIWYKGVQGSRRGFGSPYCGNNSKGKGMIRCHFSCLTPVRFSTVNMHFASPCDCRSILSPMEEDRWGDSESR